MTQRADTDTPGILTTAEAAALIRVSPRTFARYVAAGRIDVLRTPSGLPRFRREDVEQMLAPTTATG